MPRKPNTALIYERIPQHLCEMREAAGLTQRALAARLKKPPSWVARCERATRRVDVAEWVEWCYGCGVTPEASLIDLTKGRT